MNLRIHNERVFNKYMKLDYTKMSCPLLVSTKEEYIKYLQEPILYIGQETYTWLNYKDDFIYDLDNIEEGYYNFFKETPFNMNVFWKLFQECTGLEKEEFIKKIIWSNCYICGKKDDKGLTEYHKEIETISLEYLINLYKELKPKLTIFACGNREEYYKIVKEFVKYIKGYNINRLDKQNEIIIADDIVYTYHPNNLRFSKNQRDIKEKIKSLV